MTTCDICGRTADARRHPCRFERACRCWNGEPCDRLTRAARRAQAKARKP